MEETIQTYPCIIPKPGALDVGMSTFKLLKAVLKHREDAKLPEKWNRAYELRRAYHWKKRIAGLPLPVVNLLGAHHQKTVNLLTDQNPTFNVIPAGVVEEDALEVISHTAESWWENTEQQHVLEESVSTGEMYGTVGEKVRFDPDAEYPMGEVTAETMDMFNFGWYPVKCRNIQKADAVLHFWAMPVYEARRRWPEHAAKIVPDSEIIKKINDRRSEIIAGTADTKGKGYLSTISSVVKRLMSSTTISETDEETIVIECWVKDYSGDYPGNIRRVICGCCGEVVFSDLPNPSINPLLGEMAVNTYLYDKFPFSLTQSVTDPSSPYGMSDYEQLEVLNIEINKAMSQLTLARDSSARVKAINPEGSNVPNEHFNNMSGVLSPTITTAHLLRYMDPPKIDQALITSVELYRDFFFSIAGTFDLESANAPGKNVIAYKAIAAVLENVSRMLKGKVRNYSKMIRERGRMWLSMSQNWYTEERFVTFDYEGASQTMPVSYKTLLIPAKLTVISGSTLPRSDIQKREESIELFGMGALPVDEFLKDIGRSNWKEIAKKLQAGPLGTFFEALGQLGAPPELIQYLQEVAQMNPKDVERGIKSGDVPMFADVLTALTQGEAPEDPMIESDLAIKEAQKEKLIMDSELVREKINTEKVNQRATLAGIDLDVEQLRIDRAKAATEIETKKSMSENPDTKPSAKKVGQGPYREKGMKTNNEAKGE